jgi:DNA-binding IclR family transcriptional regulator
MSDCAVDLAAPATRLEYARAEATAELVMDAVQELSREMGG